MLAISSWSRQRRMLTAILPHFVAYCSSSSVKINRWSLQQKRGRSFVERVGEEYPQESGPHMGGHHASVRCRCLWVLLSGFPPDDPLPREPGQRYLSPSHLR